MEEAKKPFLAASWARNPLLGGESDGRKRRGFGLDGAPAMKLTATEATTKLIGQTSFPTTSIFAPNNKIKEVGTTNKFLTTNRLLASGFSTSKKLTENTLLLGSSLGTKPLSSGLTYSKSEPKDKAPSYSWSQPTKAVIKPTYFSQNTNLVNSNKPSATAAPSQPVGAVDQTGQETLETDQKTPEVEEPVTFPSYSNLHVEETKPKAGKVTIASTKLDEDILKREKVSVSKAKDVLLINFNISGAAPSVCEPKCLRPGSRAEAGQQFCQGGRGTSR